MPTWKLSWRMNFAASIGALAYLIDAETGISETDICSKYLLYFETVWVIDLLKRSADLRIQFKSWESLNY